MSAKCQEALFETGERAGAYVLFVNRRERNFTRLVEPDAARRAFVHLDAARDQPVDGPTAGLGPRLDEFGIADAFRHHEVVKLFGIRARALAAGAKAAGGHQYIAVAQLAAALVDQQNFGALLAGAHGCRETGQPSANNKDV